jgi:hypothetical protein
MFRVLSSLYWIVKGVRVYALVGESGTGKSFRAKLVAQKHGIELIIDDGLLIRDDKILAGKSAKQEQAFMAAVKTALFHEKAHRDQIARALQLERFKRILIIGTSERMVNKITERLQLPKASKLIKIEDIASDEEIEKAKRTRKVEGKHVIPVPALEIRKSYPQIFYDSVRVFLQRNAVPIPLPPRKKHYEKALVRPEYSKRGRVAISSSALSQMVVHCIAEFNDKIRIRKVNVKSDMAGYHIIATIDVPYGTNVSGHIHNLQEYIVDSIEKYTGILIEEVNIVIDRISPP